jgi:hypothetical protein
MCCTGLGKCGIGYGYCGYGCQSGACTEREFCGNWAHGRVCDSNYCCGEGGLCGLGPKYCGHGCQSGPCYATPSLPK